DNDADGRRPDEFQSSHWGVPPSERALGEVRQRIPGRQHAGAVDVESAAGPAGADTDGRDRRPTAAKGQLGAGQAPAEAAEAEIEAGDREATLRRAEEGVPFLLEGIANLTFD